MRWCARLRAATAPATVVTRHGGGELSGPAEAMARAAQRHGKKRGTVQWLTAILLVLLARQGRHGVRRIDGGELRWPATERRWWRRCRASGGPWVGGEEGGGRGGARGCVGEARGGRWPRESSSAAAGVFGGCARESQRRRGARGESERPGGVRGVADGVQGDERKQEVARGEAGGGRGSVGERHASPLFVLLAEEEEDKGGGGGLGRLGKLGRLWWAAR